MKVRNCYSHPVVKSYLRHHRLKTRWIGWGYKGSGRFTKRLATLFKKEDKLYFFEDAPVRSLKPGYHGGLYGITVDRKGAMFDAYGKSSLLERLNAGVEVSPEVHSLIGDICKLGISKYNWHKEPESLPEYPVGILLVDQTRGDASLHYSGISSSSFEQMLTDALRETPETIPIYLKTHPDHAFRAKKSCFPDSIFNHPRVTTLPSDLSLSDCFSFCKRIYVGSSLAGMEAILHDRVVITYGWNFYAGWGLTEDRGPHPKPLRTRKLTKEELFQAYYLDYCYYTDPHTFEKTSLSRIIEHVTLQKKHWKRLTGDYQFTGALTPWHKHVLSTSLNTPTVHIRNDSGRKLVWGMKNPSDENVIRVEDGFIRSRELGANFSYPLSLVIDPIGIYFNAERPSRLENILNTAEWTADELKEGTELLSFLQENHITKYMTRASSDLPLNILEEARQTGKKILLIPGQVDSDASIKYGSPEFSSNKEFLEFIRHQFPDAFLIYKPHPDLLSHARSDAPTWDNLEEQCDLLVTNGDIIAWVKAVDEVHTLTSTVGFEALTHHTKVFTYGLPFYAGWGLTTDHLTCARRTRRCNLSELVTATLINYPIYVDPNNGEYMSALTTARLLTSPHYHPRPTRAFLKLLAKVKRVKNTWK